MCVETCRQAQPAVRPARLRLGHHLERALLGIKLEGVEDWGLERSHEQVMLHHFDSV